jgi:ABC-type multidrug transport system ATPase subunit
VRVETRSGAVLVDDVSFALESGSFLAIVGPSGSGKSTLLRALSGVDRPTAGSLQLDGRDLHTDDARLRTRLGIVPQDDIVQPELTVGASVGYAAELRFPPDVPRADRRARVDEVLAQLELSDRRRTPIKSLSGGQRKRVSVATELLVRPSLLFLDEPTSGLDPGLERSLMEVLRELADGGRTVVCVTHSVDSLDLCDRVLYLAPGGGMAYFGPPGRAAAYFGQPSLQRVFQSLAEESGWKERFERSAVHDEFVDAPLAATTAAAAISPGPSEAASESGSSSMRTRLWRHQLSTTTRRYAHSLVADRRSTLILLATAPVLGVVFLLRLPTDQLRSLGPGEVPLISQATAPLMLLALAMTQLGINASARQIVRELALFRRERMVGLSVSAYLASKFLVLGAVGAAQALPCVAIALAHQGGPDDGVVLASGRAELVVVFFVTWLAGMALGLLCSALSSSESRLNLLLPAILGVQTLAVTGSAIASIPSVPVLDQAEYVSSASWGFTAAASTSELNRLNAFNNAATAIDVLPDRFDPRRVLADTLSSLELRDPSDVDLSGDSDFDHDPTTWWRAMLVLGGLTVGPLVAAGFVLRRQPAL